MTALERKRDRPLLAASSLIADDRSSAPHLTVAFLDADVQRRGPVTPSVRDTLNVCPALRGNGNPS